MNNQELLELINKTWPLGVNTDSDIPKLRLQRDEKIIYGYSLNISRVLDIFYNYKTLKEKLGLNSITNETLKGIINSTNISKVLNSIYNYIPETLKENLKSNSITNETFNGIINSTLFLYLTKCLLEFNRQDRIIVVGHSKNGQPLLFCSDDGLNKELSIKLHTNIDNSYNKTPLESNKNTPLIKRFIDYFYDGFNQEFGIPFVMIKSNSSMNPFPLLPLALSSSIDINQSKLGFLEYFQIELKTFYEQRNVSNYSIADILKNEISEEYKKGGYVYSLLNRIKLPINNLLIPIIVEFPQITYGGNLIFTNLFNPLEENLDYILDYMLINDKIIFLNDFDLNKYYEHNLELINKICELSSNTETYKNKFVLCQNQIMTLLKEKEIITDFKLDKVLDISGLTNLIETNKYWRLKKICRLGDSDNIEFFPKDLILSTENINTKSCFDSLLIDGNIELNIFGINKLKKVPYNGIEPIKDETIEIDAEKNRQLWANRDKLYKNEFGAWDYFVSQDGEFVPRKFYLDLFTNFIDNFSRCYLDSDYLRMRECVKNNLGIIEHIVSKIDDVEYTKIANNIKPELEIDKLVDTVCSFANYWNLKLNYSKYENNLIKRLIRYLSFSGKINDKNYFALEKYFKMSYMNSFINKKNSKKASKIRNLMCAFFSEKELDCYEQRKILYEFLNLIGQNYEKELHEKTFNRVTEINSYTLCSLFKIKKDSLLLKLKNNLVSIVENIMQYPDYKGKNDLLNELQNSNNFGSLYSTINTNSLFFPETIRNKLIETTEKLAIIDKIKLDGFKQKTATLLINIYYDLEREKEYTVDELKAVWAKRNAELEYNTKEEYSFEVTLINLLKAGFLNGKTYLVNL